MLVYLNCMEIRIQIDEDDLALGLTREIVLSIYMNVIDE